MENPRHVTRLHGLHSFAILGLFVCLFNPEFAVAEDAGTPAIKIDTPIEDIIKENKQDASPETVAKVPENNPEEKNSTEEEIKTLEEIKKPDEDTAKKEALEAEKAIKTAGEEVKKTDEEVKEKDKSAKEDEETKIDEIKKFEAKKSAEVQKKKKSKSSDLSKRIVTLTFRTGKLACENPAECQKSPLDVYPFITMDYGQNKSSTYAVIDPKSDPQKQIDDLMSLVKKSGLKMNKERKDEGLEGQRLHIKGQSKKRQILFIPVKFSPDGKEIELAPEKISLIKVADVLSPKQTIDELTKRLQMPKEKTKKLTPQEEAEFKELRNLMTPYFKKIENKVSGRNREELIASLKEVVDGIIRKDLSDKNLKTGTITSTLKLPDPPERPNKEEIRDNIYDNNRAKLNELESKYGSYSSEYRISKGELDEKVNREYRKQESVYDKEKKKYDEQVRGKQDTVSQIKDILETFVSQFKIASERDIFYPQLLIYKQLSNTAPDAPFYTKKIKDLFAKDIFADVQVGQNKGKGGKKDRSSQKMAIAGAASVILPLLFSGKPQPAPPQPPQGQQPYGYQPNPYPNPSPNPSPRPSYSTPGASSPYGGSSIYPGPSSRQESDDTNDYPYGNSGSRRSSQSNPNSGYQWESFATEGMDAMIVPIRYDDYSSDDPYESYGSKSYSSSNNSSYSSQSSSSYSSSYDPYASTKKVTEDKKQIPLNELLFDKDQMLRYAISQLDRNHASCNSRSNCLKDDKKKLEDILNKINRKNKAWPILREIRDQLDSIESDPDSYIGIDEAIREFRDTQYTKIPSTINNKNARVWDTIMKKKKKIQDDLKNDNKTIEADKVIIVNMAQVKNKYKILTPAEQKTKDKVDKVSKVTGAMGAMQQGGSGGLLGYLEGLFGQKKGTDDRKKYKEDDSSNQNTMSDILNMLGK